jgi:hypothetical protein
LIIDPPVVIARETPPRPPSRREQSADFSGTRKAQADYFHGNL